MSDDQIRSHSELIDALGGPAEVSRLLAASGEKVGRSAVSLWRRRGIARRLRGRITVIATGRGVPLPPGFLLT